MLWSAAVVLFFQALLEFSSSSQFSVIKVISGNDLLKASYRATFVLSPR